MWQDYVAWFQSPGGARVLQTAIIPALAIIVAGIVAALIARSAVRASIRRADRAEASTAVGALVAAARASTGPDGQQGSRLRSEADVRIRLLPLPGAGVAADWAAARMDALQQQSADGPVSGEIDELRDRLVEWVGRPARAKRVFAAPVAHPFPPAQQEAAEPASDVEQETAPPERVARPVSGPLRTPAPEEAVPAVDAPAPEPEEQPVLAGAAPAVAVAQTSSAAAVPAWQRTRAVERLQQERSRSRAVEPPSVDEDDAVPMSTAPVQLPHAHRAPNAPTPEADEAVRLEAVRLEAHQQARHARPTDEVAAPGGAAYATPAPAWLDTYDDEAHVTQNLDLKTPPPVAAAAVRDRGAPGEDVVPRS